MADIKNLKISNLNDERLRQQFKDKYGLHAITNGNYLNDGLIKIGLSDRGSLFDRIWCYSLYWIDTPIYVIALWDIGKAREVDKALIRKLEKEIREKLGGGHPYQYRTQKESEWVVSTVEETRKVFKETYEKYDKFGGLTLNSDEVSGVSRVDAYMNIDKVLRQRKKKNGKVEFLISFRNDDKEMWVPEYFILNTPPYNDFVTKKKEADTHAQDLKERNARARNRAKQKKQEG